jgi:peptide/nickel transport system permease protein
MLPRRSWRRTGPEFVIACSVLVLIAVAVVLAPLFSPYDPAQQSEDTLQSPSALHWFGTDVLGRDTLSRTLYGGAPILLASLGAVVLATLVGSALGLLSGYRGGWFEHTVVRVVDVLLAFPTILLAILMVAALGPGVSKVMVAVAVSQIPVFARAARASVLGLAGADYVLAARAGGASDARIILRHVLPNVLGVMLVQTALVTALAIGYVGALSYVGLGVQPPQADWGTMVSDASKYVYDAPYLAIFPGAAITVTVMACNYLADGLRDLLDPHRGHN